LNFLFRNNLKKKEKEKMSSTHIRGDKKAAKWRHLHICGDKNTAK